MPKSLLSLSISETFLSEISEMLRSETFSSEISEMSSSEISQSDWNCEKGSSAYTQFCELGRP